MRYYGYIHDADTPSIEEVLGYLLAKGEMRVFVGETGLLLFTFYILNDDGKTFDPATSVADLFTHFHKYRKRWASSKGLLGDEGI